MPHTADPVSEQHSGDEDAFRQEIEQIVARRNLMKARNDAAAPPPKPASLRRAPAEPDAHPDPAPEPVADWREEEDADAEFVAFAGEPDPRPRPSGEFAVEEQAPEADDRPERLIDRRQGERRQGERRNMEFLRTEIQWSANPEPTERKKAFGAGGLRRSRLLLLGVAALSAVVAAWLALSGAPAPAPEPEPVAIAAPVELTADVLVATAEIGAGQHISEANIAWQKLPVSAMLPGYISQAARPDALADLARSVARYPFLPGDPIREDKLVPDTPRTLAATLAPGMRAMSVNITADSASGGFLKPDDHVDVVLVTNNEGQRVTRTILEDVRVLAINAQLGPETTGEVVDAGAALGDVFAGPALATLELGPEAAEVLARAVATGTLTLTLRPEGMPGASERSARSGANQAIRMTSRFWTDTYSPASN